MLQGKKIRSIAAVGIIVSFYVVENFAVEVVEEEIHKIPTYKVTTENGVFHWESATGNSGWISMFDNNGKDWTTAGPNPRGVGNQSDYRGFPNTGVDDWGHPSREYGFTAGGTTNQIIGEHSGDRVIIQSQNSKIGGKWHCFESHIGFEITKLENGVGYQMLWEGTPGGQIHSPGGVVTADGKTSEIKSTYDFSWDWPEGDVGEWFYILDPNEKFNLWIGGTPATNHKGWIWYQWGNMDLAAFGKGSDGGNLLTNADAKYAFGFIPYEWSFEQSKQHIEKILANPLEPLEKVVALKHTTISGNKHTHRFSLQQNLVEYRLVGDISSIQSVVIYDALGKQFTVLDNHAGNVVWNTRNVRPGMYLAHFRGADESTTSTQKITVLK